MRAGQDNGEGRDEAGDGERGSPAAAARAVEGVVVVTAQVCHRARYSSRALVGNPENHLACNSAAAHPRSRGGEIAAVTQRFKVQSVAARPRRIGEGRRRGEAETGIRGDANL